MVFCQIPTITNSPSQLDPAYVKKIIAFYRFPFSCICFCILAEVDDHWKHQFSPIGILGEENAPRVLLLFEHSNGNQIFGKVSIHDLGNATPVCHCYSSIQIRFRLHWRFLQRFPFTIWENCLFSLWHELRIDFYSTSKCPCCVISALSWDTNENPSKDKLTRSRAIK